VEDEDDWMARYFFTGGTMPSSDLLLQLRVHICAHAQEVSTAWHEAAETNLRRRTT